ncbi:MAG TPA: 23S rRNA (pseudouridine(1915)-N(3))-methyltransferase RlmH [Acidobacteriota bacterium]|nr:23S rRNA (pseudouridine(1915)-N(3))-methyltransferase RlmH [Acidobacteriota bacterium]
MSTLSFCWVGKTKAPYAVEGVAEYVGRITRYHECRVVVVPEERQDGRYSKRHRLEREGRRILSHIGQLEPAWVAVLDAGGTSMSSREFARMIRRACFEDTRSVVFVVGGPDGLSYAVRERADHVVSLSQLTVPHDMARLLLAEQVYRAMTIIRGHPYNR